MPSKATKQYRTKGGGKFQKQLQKTATRYQLSDSKKLKSQTVDISELLTSTKNLNALITEKPNDTSQAINLSGFGFFARKHLSIELLSPFRRVLERIKILNAWNLKAFSHPTFNKVAKEQWDAGKRKFEIDQEIFLVEEIFLSYLSEKKKTTLEESKELWKKERNKMFFQELYETNLDFFEKLDYIDDEDNNYNLQI